MAKDDLEELTPDGWQSVEPTPDPEPVASVTAGPDVAVTFKLTPQVIVGVFDGRPLYRCSVCNAAADREADIAAHLATHS